MTIESRIEKLSAVIDPVDDTFNVVEKRFAVRGSAAEHLRYLEEAWGWIADGLCNNPGEDLDEEADDYVSSSGMSQALLDQLQILFWGQRRDGKQDYVVLIVAKAERDYAEEQGVEPTVAELKYFHESLWPNAYADFLAGEQAYQEWLANQ